MSSRGQSRTKSQPSVDSSRLSRDSSRSNREPSRSSREPTSSSGEPPGRSWPYDEEDERGDIADWTIPTSSNHGNRNAAIVSGSRGMLGKVLEKMHRGEILSQHEVSAALRDFNQMNSTIAELERKTKHLRLQVYPEDPFTTGMPQAGGPENITKDTERSLRQQIERKDKLIADLQKRLNNLNHVNTSKAPLNISVADMSPPAKVVDNFCNLFEVEWSFAFETLKLSWKDEERALHSLFRVVRHAYVFCFDLAEAQRMAVEDTGDRLQEAMLKPAFTHPVSKQKFKPSMEVSAETQKCIEVGGKMLKEYRNIFVTRAIPGVQELFRKVKLPEIFETGFVTKGVRDFVNRLVELMWLMVVQEPPMLIYWLEPKRTFLPEYFNYFDEKGKYVKQTVWPAVFLREDGPILSKGVIVATADDENE